MQKRKRLEALNFRKQGADAEAVLKVLLPLPFLPNIVLTFFNRCKLSKVASQFPALLT